MQTGILVVALRNDIEDYKEITAQPGEHTLAIWGHEETTKQASVVNKQKERVEGM